MGLLDHLWDDTVSRLGKLRRNANFGFQSNSSKESEQVAIDRREEAAAEDGVRVSRSIMIVKPQQGSQKDSPPVSPAGFTPPESPFAGNGGGGTRRRRSISGGDDDDDEHHLRTRRIVSVQDTGALLLLTTCDM